MVVSSATTMAYHERESNHELAPIQVAQIAIEPRRDIDLLATLGLLPLPIKAPQ